MNILFIISLITVITYSLVFIINKYKDYKKSKKEDQEYNKYLTTLPDESVIFNVDAFNEWFCDNNNGAVYANAGIFLRLDKFEESQIVEYLKTKWNIKSVDCVKWSKSAEEMVYIFYKEIRKDWNKKLHK